MITVRGSRCLLASMLACLWAGMLSGGQNRQANQTPEQLTPQDCAVCHEDIVKAFAHNPHAILEKSPDYKLANPCESCHGPGQEHIESGGEASKIISFEGSNFQTYLDRCIKCHRGARQVRAFTETLHAKQKLECADCHRNHNAALTTPLLKESQNTLCMRCHTMQRAQFSKPFHHRVMEKAMRCTDCHQPHSGLNRHMVRNGMSGEKVCFDCHSEKQGPFVFEHAAVRISGCLGCHEPHGSNNSKMLIRSTVQALCVECHSTSRNVLTSQPPSFHNLNSPIYQNCTTCHVMIHGSNFSSFYFR
jgi:DmsE family decaheme c-type cytochrome